MSNFKGTKGKWLNHKYAFATIISENNMLVASCGGRTTNVNPEELILEQEANALLISKAPEMLEMLEKMVDIIDRIHPDIKPIALLALRMNAKELIKSATEL